MLPDMLELSLLFDFYGDLLTDRQRICFDLHRNQDLSLAEIAESEGISRQGVHDSIVRAEAALRHFEETMGCVRRERRLQEGLERIAAAAATLQNHADGQVRRLADQIVSAVHSLKE